MLRLNLPQLLASYVYDINVKRDVLKLQKFFVGLFVNEKVFEFFLGVLEAMPRISLKCIKEIIISRVKIIVSIEGVVFIPPDHMQHNKCHQHFF